MSETFQNSCVRCQGLAPLRGRSHFLSFSSIGTATVQCIDDLDEKQGEPQVAAAFMAERPLKCDCLCHECTEGEHAVTDCGHSYTLSAAARFADNQPLSSSSYLVAPPCNKHTVSDWQVRCMECDKSQDTRFKSIRNALMCVRCQDYVPLAGRVHTIRNVSASSAPLEPPILSCTDVPEAVTPRANETNTLEPGTDRTKFMKELNSPSNRYCGDLKAKTTLRAKIWKFRIPESPFFTLDMPVGARVLTTQMQGQEAYLWARVVPASATEMRRFRVLMTGEDHELHFNDQYIGTFQTEGGLVCHLFDETGCT